MRSILALVVAVAALAGAEMTARHLAPGFEERIEWYDATSAIKDRQIEALRQDGVSVVLAGTSMMRDGGDPARLLAAGLPVPSVYNASLSNGSPILMERWLEDHVVPRLDPLVVVWGLTSFELNDNSTTMIESFNRYSEAPRSDLSLLGRLETLVDEHSALFSHQADLRSPEAIRGAWQAVANGAAARETPLAVPGEIASLGNTLTRLPESLLDRNIEAQADVLNETAFNDFRIGGLQSEALERTTMWLQERGIDVVYVVMPTAYEYVDSIDEAHWQQLFLAELDDISSRLGVPVLRPDLLISDAGEFADLIHMNNDGVEAFTGHLVDELAELADAGVIELG